MRIEIIGLYCTSSCVYLKFDETFRIVSSLTPFVAVSFGGCQPLFPENFKTLGSGSISGFPEAGWFGTSVAYLGDVDGDGFGDIAVGSRDDGGIYNGVWPMVSTNQ